MAVAAPKACRCGGKRYGNTCDRCGTACRPKDRGTNHKRMYNRSWWKRASKQYRKENPRCEVCLENGKATLATQVDHIRPHDGNDDLFADVDNWQSICDECHGIKTRSEGRQPTGEGG